MIAHGNTLWRQSYQSVNWQSPINWRHHVNDQLVCRLIVNPFWTGGTIIEELTRHHSGVFNGGPTWVTSSRPGGFGAIEGTGASAYVAVADNNDINLNRPFTLSFWIKRNTTQSAFPVVMTKESGTGSAGGYIVFINAGGGATINCRIRAADNSNATVTSTIALSVGVWYYVAFTYDGTTLRCFVDGIARGTTATTIAIGNTTVDLTLFNDAGSLGTKLDGQLDDIAINESLIDPMVLYQSSRTFHPEAINRIPMPSYAPAAAPGGFSPYWALGSTLIAGVSGGA